MCVINRALGSIIIVWTGALHNYLTPLQDELQFGAAALTAGYQQPHACSEMVRPVTWSCTVELQSSRLPSSGRGLSINHRVCSKVNICLEAFKNDNAPLNGCVFFI